jgi:hypothetical protein
MRDVKLAVIEVVPDIHTLERAIGVVLHFQSLLTDDTFRWTRASARDFHPPATTKKDATSLACARVDN